MAWATFETNGKFCVFALDADNNKKGEALECYPSREQAQTYVKGLYSKEGKAEKAGARHSSGDNSLIQKAHDMLCELGAACKEMPRGGEFENTDKLSIFKDATGKYRWIAFSSSAFRDRDREIVSTKALTDDVARADADADFGPLRFWHEPGVDIGRADFNAMEGRVLVESGTFADEAIGEALKAHSDELGISIGFTHPADEPDESGTFHHIKRFERSIVPADKASNLLTQFVVKSTGETMDATKKSLLEKLIGPDLAAKFIGQAGETQKVAEEKGIAFKETVVTTEVKADDTPAADDEKKPAFLTEAEVKAMLNKAFGEYEDKQSASKKESDTVTTKATSDILTALKAIQDGQKDLTDGVKLALTGVAELKGELPRKLGEKQVAFVPSQNGATPTGQLSEQAARLKAAMDELAGNPNDPLAKFLGPIATGVQYVQPNQPKGS